jgi:hypothetical protein
MRHTMSSAKTSLIAALPACHASKAARTALRFASALIGRLSIPRKPEP